MKRERIWSVWVMAVGIIAGLGTGLWIGKLTLVPLSTLLRAAAFCCVVLLLVPFRFTAAKLRLERLEWVLLNVLGIGPLMFSAALSSNYFVHGREQCRTHRIEQAAYSELFYRVELEGGSFGAFPGAREFQVDPEEQLNARRLRICTSRGILGADVVTRRELLAVE